MLKSETWTGTNGDPWPPQWDASAMSAGSSATIQSNRGRLAVGSAGGYADTALATLGVVAADFDLRVDLYVSDVTEHYAYLRFRDQNLGSRLYIQVYLNSGNIQLGRADSEVPTALATVPQALSASDVVHFHLRAVGSAITIAWWLNAATESAPQITVNESLYVSQTVIALFEFGGAAASTHLSEWDNLVIDEIPVGRPRATVFRF